jgi:hypothetical protein
MQPSETQRPVATSSDSTVKRINQDIKTRLSVSEAKPSLTGESTNTLRPSDYSLPLETPTEASLLYQRLSSEQSAFSIAITSAPATRSISYDTVSLYLAGSKATATPESTTTAPTISTKSSTGA